MDASRAVPRALLAAFALNTAAAAERLPVETFSRQYAYESARLSPDGSKLAVSFVRDASTKLAVIDIAHDKAVAMLAGQPLLASARVEQAGTARR